MNRLTLKLNCWLCDELEEYLMGLKGIESVIINQEQDSITITYDLELINIYMIEKEIKLFLEINDIPLIMAFDKDSDKKLDEYIINIYDLCCEYCLYGNIEELLVTLGIVKAYSDYDNVNKKNVKINVFYDSDLISVDKIILLENKFNNN